MLITNHVFVPDAAGTHCAWSRNTRDDVPICGASREEHASVLSREDQQVGDELAKRIKPMVTSADTSYERALERIRELEADVTSLRSQRQILADSERSLSIKLTMARARVGNLENDLYYSEAERLKACEEAGNLQLRLDESLAREGALNQRLSNLDALAREVSVRVEKMTSALDR